MPLSRKYLVLCGVAQRQRRHSSFILNALMVVEVNVSINQIIGFSECLWLVPVDTLCFQNGEEIFCHCIVIWIALT